MGKSPTIEELREGIERLSREIDEIDMERGYCKLQFPPVSDVWAEECYKKYWPDIKVFLADYTELVLTAKEIIPLGESERVRNWIKKLEVAAEASDTVLSSKCIILASFLLIAIKGSERLHYTNYADMVTRKLSDYPYSVYYKDRYIGDYDGNYEEYYAQKREELTKWHAN